MSSKRTKNRLAQESSPYLLQHADNPVDWYPWGNEAFDRALAEDKPVLLSVGYSACHWCHVMAHESFEDLETAEIMNRLFVNIKLDREERPDVDKIYQTSQSLITQRAGGWPLTMILDPHNRHPFFGGTYFPKEPRHNLPSFKEVLERVHDYYRTHRDDIQQQNQVLQDTLHKIYAPVEDARQPAIGLVDTARTALLRQFDQEYGGFTNEPKFPHGELLQFMLHCGARTKAKGDNDPQSEHAVLHTLKKMCQGGLYDQLGGGFYRYSVDAEWQIPHFEKMLYDNAALLPVLAETFHAGGQSWLADVARETANWVWREMQAPEGGYYATLDADSEGGEGTFYAWDKNTLAELLEPQDAEIAKRYFGLDKVPNFEGKWHLRIATSVESLATALGTEEEAVRAGIQRSRQVLFSHRQSRPRPGRDEKIITSWNALMIKGMAKTARLLGEEACFDSARRALAFIRTHLWHDGRLLAIYKNGRARFPAYLDDYAFLLDALFHVLQYRWSDDDLAFAIRLADAILEHFEDADLGGYYFTAHDQEQLIQRPRVLHDEATPSGYGVATLLLARLGLLCGNDTYTNSAHRALAQAAQTMRNSTSGCATLLRALTEQHEPPETVIIRTADAAAVTSRRWLQATHSRYSPARFCFEIPESATGLPRCLREKKIRGEVTAYLCRGTHCLAPIDTFSGFMEALAQPTFASLETGERQPPSK